MFQLYYNYLSRSVKIKDQTSLLSYNANVETWILHRKNKTKREGFTEI